MAKKATTLHDNLGNDLLPVTNASVTFMDNGTSVQAEINDLKEKTQYNKGHYTTPEELITEYPNNISNPSSRRGWYAIVGSTDTVWIWDIEGNKWSDSGVSSGGVDSVNGLDGEVILTGSNIDATATIDTTSTTKSINGHLNDIYADLENTVDLNSSQLITGTKVFTEVIGLANTSEGTVDQIKHINSNFLITSGTGQNLLNIDEGLETISAFNRELAYEDEIQQIQGDYATKSELSQEIQNVTDMIPTKVSELTNDSNYAQKSELENYVTINTAQKITGSKVFSGTVGNTQTESGIYLGLDQNTGAENANMAIVSANTASYIDMGRPNVDYDFRIIKWNTTDNKHAQFVYGGNASGTITIPQATGVMALTSDIPDTSNFIPQGGTLTAPLKVTGGDQTTAGKIILDQNNRGQITNTGTQTLFGFLDASQLAVGHANYYLRLRGISGRPSYNGKDIALFEDLPKLVTLTQAEYDALSTKDANTYYFIKEE